MNHRNHYFYWKPIRAAFLAGLTDERRLELQGGDPDKTPLHWHDLRHYHATWLLDRGASDADVAEQLGHKDGGRLVADLYGHTYNDNALSRLQEIAAREPDTRKPQPRERKRKAS